MYIKAENRFGESIVYGGSIWNTILGEDTATYTYQEQIGPGMDTGESIALSLDGFNGVKIVYLAIAQYHFKNGETIEILEEDWEWIRFEDE